MYECQLCGRLTNPHDPYCGKCRERLRHASMLAARDLPPGVGCALAAIIGVLFWALLFLLYKIWVWL